MGARSLAACSASALALAYARAPGGNSSCRQRVKSGCRLTTAGVRNQKFRLLCNVTCAKKRNLDKLPGKPGRKPRRAFACAFAPCMAQLRERFRGKATRARSMERTNESSFVGSSDCDSVPTLLFPCYFREISANYLAVSAACAILHLTHPPLQEFTGGGVELHPIAETRKLACVGRVSGTAS